MTIEVLVDYDNLTLLHKSRGLITIANQILGTLLPSDIPQKRKARIRLYGGWYAQGSSSRLAQELSVAIQANFPMIITVPSIGTKLMVSMELAFALLITPHEHLLDTYRIRSCPSDLNCDDPSKHGCGDTSCPIKNVADCIKTGKCPKSTCSITPTDILYRGEQKLVDTMLTTDLFYLSMNSIEPLVVVSSDDDFWPAIRSVLALGSKVVHIHTKPKRRTPTHYRKTAPLTYSERHL